MGSSFEPGGTTTILDLNDDCLLEVFEYVELDDLCALADVCHRFRHNSQRRFIAAQNDGTNMAQRFLTYYLSENFRKKDFLALSKVFRNFGPYIKSLNMEQQRWHWLWRDSYESRKVSDLLNRYCYSGSLIKLRMFYSSRLTEWLHRYPFFQQMEQLIFEKSSKFRLDRTYTNLTAISIELNFDITNEGVEKLLKLNPQLKKVGFVRCSNLNDHIFQSIVNHVPGIESIRMDEAILNGPAIKCVGKLRKLKSLELTTEKQDYFAYFSSILREIREADIPLENLDLFLFGDFGPHTHPPNTGRFIDEICKLKTLKVLRLHRIIKITQSHIINICRSLSELTEFCYAEPEYRAHYMTSELVLEIVKNAENLQSLLCYVACREGWGIHYPLPDIEENSIGIGVDAFMQMVQVVKRRRERMHLSVILDAHRFTANLRQESTHKYADILTLSVCKDHEGFARYGWKWL